MDKPVTLSVKDWIIRNMSVKMMVPESVIETVVNHQFISAHDALLNCNSLEFSGFGKFFFNVKRAEKKMQKFLSQKEMYEKGVNDTSLSESKRQSAQHKLDTTNGNIKALKPKLDED